MTGLPDLDDMREQITDSLTQLLQFSMDAERAKAGARAVMRCFEHAIRLDQQFRETEAQKPTTGATDANANAPEGA